MSRCLQIPPTGYIRRTIFIVFRVVKNINNLLLFFFYFFSSSSSSCFFYFSFVLSFSASSSFYLFFFISILLILLILFFLIFSSSYSPVLSVSFCSFPPLSCFPLPTSFSPSSKPPSPLPLSSSL